MNNGKNNNNIYRNLNRRQRTLRTRKKRRLGIILTLVIVLCAIWVAAFFALSHLWRGNDNPSDNTTDPLITDDTTADPSGDNTETTPATTETGIKYVTLKFAKGELHKGDLILVNADFPYVFPQSHEAALKTIYGNKNSNYKVSRSDHKLRSDLIEKLNTMFTEFAEETGKKDVQITSAYRSNSYQKEIYDREVAKHGEAEAALYVALPGNSEHHIGTAIDVNILSSADGKTYNLTEFPEYAWVTDNFHRYGFILRYTEDKIGMTGIGYEPWHFRYIGIPHAYIMKDMNYCLEEYIAYIRNFPYSGEHREYEVNGNQYEIYYVPIAEGENAVTDIPVPDGLVYTVSGNNVDGFIVTVTIK